MNIRELRIILAEAIEGTEFSGKVYFVGGAVRDFLMQRQTPDYDLTVEIPDGGIRLASFLQEKLGTPPPKLHSQFGTAMLQYRGDSLEFVMTRKEEYLPGNRNPKVSFASLEEDIMRRDFTINTLLLSVSGGSLQDPTRRGLKDIMDGLIRCTGDPYHSFSEDPVRMLRAIRFACLLNFQIDERCWIAIREKAPLVASLSQPRLETELSRIMVCVPSKSTRQSQTGEPEPGRGYRLLRESGIVAALDPGLRDHLMLLSEHSFTLLPRQLGERFGVLGASRIREMMQAAEASWYRNPKLSPDDLINLLAEAEQ